MGSEPLSQAEIDQLLKAISSGDDDQEEMNEPPRAGDDVDASAPADEPAGDDGRRQHRHRPCPGLRQPFRRRRGVDERHAEEDEPPEDHHRRGRTKHHHRRP